MPDTSAKPKTREELEKEWWDRWWAEDYSWEGLAKKNIEGSGGLNGEKTLQDYWRRDPANPMELRGEKTMELEGELLRAPDGKLWHLAHVPLHWRTGEAWKTGWDGSKRGRLRSILFARLKAAKETVVDSEFVDQSDGRAQFEGMVLDRECCHLPSREQISVLHVRAFNSWFDEFLGSDRTFGSGAQFEKCFFSMRSWLGGASFPRGASFSNSNFIQDVWFGGSSFEGDAIFSRCSFLGKAEFYSAKFSSDALFHRAAFLGSAAFGSSVFSGHVIFSEALFFNQFTFFNFRSKGIFEFSGVQWPKGFLLWHGVFNAAIFEGPVTFQYMRIVEGQLTENFVPFAAFDGATFEKPPIFATLPEGRAKDAFVENLNGLLRLRLTSDPNQIAHSIEWLAQLERGCRLLKLEMAKASDRVREHMYYRFELMARNAQSTTPWQERLASQIYETTSDYGTSITRPLVSLLPVWFAFGLIYIALAHAIHGGESLIVGNLSNGFDLSLNRMFQPLTVLNSETLKNNQVLEILLSHSWSAFLTRAFSTFQSLLSIILLFLSGLAIRRRFQIN